MPLPDKSLASNQRLASNPRTRLVAKRNYPPFRFSMQSSDLLPLPALNYPVSGLQ
ncbi:hypothetical protein DSO57_1004111 [Entomophthora muscae]|uniref:Uncharacterized protein n=1 Tax=Entomophthora muscae TaxID=34485 RepID=A0ACC2TJ73_9FUNG|nr:hypothetical protein DSO57_1004111 [Entomophthora muscae]